VEAASLADECQAGAAINVADRSASAKAPTANGNFFPFVTRVAVKETLSSKAWEFLFA